MDPLLENVFKISGVPTHTFVEPSHFDRLQVALRTPGRGVIVEGPSGIGKSTAVANSLARLGMSEDVLELSARSPSDLEYIAMLPTLTDFGIAIIDDFHRLPANLQNDFADLLKRLADAGSSSSKLVVIGINQAGAPLIAHAPDLANRVDRIKFESEPHTKLAKVIELGEAQLNVSIAAKDNIVDAAQGSFYLIQLLCHEACLQAQVTEAQPQHTSVPTLYSSVKRQVMERQKAQFGASLRNFARGNKFRPSGRAPYFHMLNWLSGSDTGTIDLREQIRTHPNEKVSVKATMDNKGIDTLAATDGISQIFYYSGPPSTTLAIEDPHAIFYLRNLDFAEFLKEVGFTKVDFDRPYDIALSFAGEDRPFAELLYDYLTEAGFAVFYDEAESSRILAEDVEEILAPVYESDSRFVVAVLGAQYGIKRWTIFEASKFKPRIEAGEVIPIWSTRVPQSAFDDTYKRGGRSFDPAGDLDAQANAIAALIVEKLAASD